MTVRELLERTDSRELAEWQAFYALEPWGNEVEWLRFGTVASIIANVNRGRNRRPFRPTDFVPKPPKEPQTVEEQLSMFEAFAAAQNSTDTSAT